MASRTSRAKSLRFLGDSVYIDSFLPPADCQDDPTQDDDFPELLAQVRATKAPPSPIRVVKSPDGIRLLDRDAYKLCLACRGGELEGTGGMGMLNKGSVILVRPGASDRDQQDDGAGDEHQVEGVPTYGQEQAPGQREARVMKVADLRPNSVNSTVFATSLSDEGISELADDIRQRGLRHPVEVSPNGTILDGERRWRALGLLNMEETNVVVVHGIEDDDIEDYVLDAFSSVRDANVEERIGVFRLAQRVLARRHGRPQGHPAGKHSQVENVFWKPEKIRTEAAKRAGFSSYSMANKAAKVFKEGDEDLKASVNAGELSISAAYNQLPKQSRASGGKKSKASIGGAGEHKDKADEDTDTARGESNEASASRTGAASERADEDTAAQSDGTRQGAGGDNDRGNAARGEAETADEQPQANSSTEPAQPGLEVAWRVVLDFLGKSKPDQVKRHIQALAARAGFVIWFPPEEAVESLEDLGGFVREQVEHLAAEDNEVAWDWIGLHEGELQGLQSAHATHGQDE